MMNKKITYSILLCLLSLLYSYCVSAQSDKISITLRWEPISGALEYEIQVATDSEFNTIVINKRSKRSRFKLPELPRSAHFWRVRSIDSDGRFGIWSQSQSVFPHLGAPILHKPADRARIEIKKKNMKLGLSFESPTGTGACRIEISTDSGFKSVLFSHQTESKQEAIPLPDIGEYFWRVRCKDVTGRSLPVSKVRSFQVVMGSPELIKPQKGEAIAWSPEGVNIQLLWAKMNPVAKWEVQLQQDAEPIKSKSLRQNTLVLTPVGPAVWRWRVRGMDRNGSFGPYSAWSSIHVTYPRVSSLETVPASPIGFRGDNKAVKFKWTSLQMPLSYYVEISQNEDFSTILKSGRTVNSQWTADEIMEGKYWWRVKVGDEDRIASFSHPVSMELKRLQSLSPPELAAPIDQTIIDPNDGSGVLHLEWSETAEARTYQVELTPLYQGERLRNQYSNDHHFDILSLKIGEYNWRVRALDEDEIPGLWSSARSFYYGVPESQRAKIEYEAEDLKADGRTEVVFDVTLFDRQDRVVPSTYLEASCSSGEVQPDVSSEDGGRFRYRTPKFALPENKVAVSFKDRGFEQTIELEVTEKIYYVMLGLGIGYRSNFNSINSVMAQVDLTGRIPLTSDNRHHLLLSLRSGYFGAGSSLAAGEGLPEPISNTAHIVPIGLAAVYEYRALKVLPLYFGVYGGADVAWFEVGEDAEYGVGYKVHGLLGIGYILWPGQFFLELSGGYGLVSSSLAELDTSGLGLIAGYRFDLW